VIAEDPPPITEIDPTIPEAAVQIVARALVKDREKRYQTGLELAEDLRALAHTGSASTVRTSDANHPTISLDPTAEGSIPGLPTLATPGTVSTPPTVASAPTRVAGTPPPIPPPLPTAGARPTSPPVARPPATSAPRPAAARSSRPAAARPQPSGGGKAIAIVGGAAVVLLLAVGAWWMLGRGSAPAPSPEATPEASATSTPPTTLEKADVGTASPTPAEATPVATRATTPEPPASQPTPRPAPTAAPPVATAPPRAPPSAAAPTTTASAGSPAPSDGFLDSVPTDDSPDGRAMAAELSRGFSSGGGGGGNSSFGTSRNLRRRTVIPPHTMAEQPAVRTLAWILTAEKAHHRRAGRFGSFSEIVGARDLPLEQVPSGDGFTRRGYRFTVRTTDEGFRAEAHPLTPDGRAFYVDEAGYVLADD